MKKCLQCDQVYGDDTNFCLSDGSTLVSVSGSYPSHGEAPTVYSGQSLPTSNINPPSYTDAPFTPPVSYGAPPAAEPPKSHTLLIALAVGFFALVVGGAVVGLVMYGLLKPDDGNVSNSADKSPKPTPTEQKSDNDNREQKLKEQQEKIDKDKQKLEDQRKALENKKKEATPTPPPSTATTATVIDPPSNVRAAPNGRVLCVLQRRGTIVNILGSTGVTDNNGTWYYTDACGTRGVIHSSQFRF